MSETSVATRRKTVQTVAPWFIQWILYAILLIAGATSVPRLGALSPLPVTSMLDAWVIAFIVFSFFFRKHHSFGALLFIALYSLTRILPAIVNEAPLYDFLQAYRWLIYLIAVAFVVGQKWEPIKPLVYLTWALTLMALTKSVLTWLVIGPGERPGLFLENNFELPLFCGLTVVLYRFLDKSRPWLILSLAVLTILAGSRSGIISFAIVAIFALTQISSKRLILRYIVLTSFGALAWAIYDLFVTRFTDAGSIDRLNFLGVFIGEVRDWGPLNWLFGTTPITPLSSAGCGQLSYYELLFSSAGDQSCYSVILHAFILRVIFDAGLIGLIIAFGTLIYLMRRGQVQWSIVLALLANAFANSFSVSGPNNPYVILPILLAIFTSNESTYLSVKSSLLIPKMNSQKYVSNPPL